MEAPITQFKIRKFALPILLIMAGVCFWIWRYQIPSHIDFTKTSFIDLRNQQTPFESWTSDSTVVHFYARWCGPCLREMREIRKFLPQLNIQGVRVVFVSDDPIEEMRVMATDFPNCTFLHVSSMKELGVYSIPTSYFLLKKNVVYETVGSLTWDERTLDHFKK